MDTEKPIEEDAASEEPAGGPYHDPFEPDDAAKIIADMPPEVVAFEGYLGEARGSDYRRLYKDEKGQVWLTIHVNDIVGRISKAGDGDLTAGASVVWVRSNAEVLHCKRVRASSYQGPPPGGDDSTAYTWP